MAMPTMKRNAGKTRSTNVMPLFPWKCRIHAGTIWVETPAMSFTKIIMNMTKPRRASMEVIRGRPIAARAEASGRLVGELGVFMPDCIDTI